VSQPARTMTSPVERDPNPPLWTRWYSRLWPFAQQGPDHNLLDPLQCCEILLQCTNANFLGHLCSRANCVMLGNNLLDPLQCCEILLQCTNANFLGHLCSRANCVTFGTALDEPRQTGAECQISAQRDYWCRRDPKP